MIDNTSDLSDDLRQSMEEDERITEELAILFGRDTVNLARQIDIIDLNLNEEMTKSITSGVSKLKELKSDPVAQIRLIKGMEAGARLILCMWIMDMGLLDKIQVRPDISSRL